MTCGPGSPGISRPADGMAPGQRLALPVAAHAPEFGGWFLGRLAALARRSPPLFLRVATSELPGIDRRALAQPAMQEAFLAGYAEAFRRGSWGVAQDLRILTRPWGFELGAITVPTSIHHGQADTTVPPQHARLLAQVIPGARLQLYPGHGHFSILGAARQILAPSLDRAARGFQRPQPWQLGASRPPRGRPGPARTDTYNDQATPGHGRQPGIR